MAFSWQDIVHAFIEDTYSPASAAAPTAEPSDEEVEVQEVARAQPKRLSAVSFGLRSPSAKGGGYIRVWGPSADSGKAREAHVLIDRHTGSITVTEPIAIALGGLALRRTDVDITANPMGFSCGPNHGRQTSPPSRRAIG